MTTDPYRYQSTPEERAATKALHRRLIWRIVLIILGWIATALGITAILTWMGQP